MELNKVEKEIIDYIISKIDTKKVPSKKDLNFMISQEIDKRIHLKENWQKFYIEKRIQNAVKDFITPKKNHQTKKLVIIAIILFPLILLPGVLGVLGFYIYLIIMIQEYIEYHFDGKEEKSFDYYKRALSKYSDFSGRSTKEEFWYFILYSTIISLLLYLFGVIIGDEDDILNILYSSITLIPYWAVSVRRLHDVGKSGWVFLFGFIPLIGLIWMLIIFTTDSELGANKYGPNSKQSN